MFFLMTLSNLRLTLWLINFLNVGDSLEMFSVFLLRMKLHISNGKHEGLKIGLQPKPRDHHF